SKADALFGLGYVHAQDRLWQMEFQRRVGHGRLSEVLGPATLPQDRFLRTVGFGRAARAAWARMSDRERRDINAYIAGINAFLDSHHHGALPPEFTLLGFEPAPWTGEDVIVWAKMMAWDLSANYSLELLRHDLVRRVGADRMAQLMPPYPNDGLTILTASDLRRMQPPIVHAPRDIRATEGVEPGERDPDRETASAHPEAAASFFSALADGDLTVARFLAGNT